MPEVTFSEVAPHRFRATSAVAITTWMQDEPALRLLDIHRLLASSTATAEQRAAAEFARRKITQYLDAYGAVQKGLRVE